MPYFIYRVQPIGALSKLCEFDSFRQASDHAKALRSADAPGTPGKIKVMFAENELQAEELLCQVREPGPSGDD